MRSFLAFTLICALACAPAWAAEPSVKKALTKALDERDPRARASAVSKALSGVDGPAHTKTVAKLVLATEQPAIVKNVAVVMLGRMRDPKVLPALKALAEKGSLEQRAHVVRAIGRSRATGAVDTLLELRKHQTGRQAVDLLPAILTALCERDDLDALEVGPRLGVEHSASLGLRSSAWQVRSAAARLSGVVGGKLEGLGLCDVIKLEDGRLADDCARALERISGKRWGADPDRYRNWFVRKSEEAPDEAWNPRDVAFESPLVRTRSRRILFVLSRSISMGDAVDGASHPEGVHVATNEVAPELGEELRAAKTKLEVARVHLRVMIRSLRDGVEFDVMTYASSPGFAFGELTKAGRRTRKKAEGRVESLSASGDADIYGALRRAFDRKGKDPLGTPGGPDTIVLLTDGNLQEPYTTDREEIQRAVDHWKRTRQIVVHVVAVGQSVAKLLGPLAKGAPAGAYVSVP